MSSEVWKQVWNDFCDSQVHLDSLLTRLNPNVKSKVAENFGAFLRRPWTLSQALQVPLAESPEAFWSQSFIALRKNPQIHLVLDRLPRMIDRLPTQGGVEDFPSALRDEWTADFGIDVTNRLAQLLSQDPHTMIRVHRKAAQTIDTLFPHARKGRLTPTARVFKGYEAVLRTDAYQNGDYEIQDEGSQFMSWFTLFPEVFSAGLSEGPQLSKLNFTCPTRDSFVLPKEIKTVIDACAGGGGKTLALADALQGQARIFAYDVSEKKIQSLRRRVSRSGDRNVQAKVLSRDDPGSTLQEFHASADLLLLDAPCSGWGVLKRNPDSKWNRKPRAKLDEPMPSMIELQRKVVAAYVPLVKPGGRIVFGVCTFQKSETSDQIKWIQSEFSNLELEYSGYIGPYETDGFYMASFRVRV